MSLLSDFFKGRKKSNATPDIVPLMPSQVNPGRYNELNKLASDWTQGNNTGFGPEYVDKNVNPVASAMRRNFQQFTAPTTASAYSARGLGRSSLAANELGRQEGDVESNVAQLMAQFYQLNEAQKKSDQQFGANLGSNILTNDVNAQHKQADTSMQINKNTANEQQNRYAANDAKAGQFIQGGAQLVAPILSKFMPTASVSAPQASQAPVGATTKILGSLNPSNLQAMNIEELLALYGG